MHFDVPKVVRSPRCDHGHDEESRNGRDMKNDILEAYVWTSEVFQVKSGFYRNTGRVTGTPGSIMGQHGPWWRGERAALMGCAPPPSPSPIRTRRGGRPPSLSLPL